MKKPEIRNIIKEEIKQLNELNYINAERPKNLIKKNDYANVIPKELLKSQRKNIKEELIKEFKINGGVWLSPDTFANKKLIEAGQIHLKGYIAELMPNGKVLWLMPNKGGRDWKVELKYLKNFFGNVKTEPHELDSLKITLPKKSDKVELELILTGKMEK